MMGIVAASSRRTLVVGVLAFFAGGTTPAAAQIIKTGSFAKATGGAPVAQSVPHGLGQTPTALILWTDGKTNNAFSGSFQYALGFSDGTASASVAATSQNG